MRTGEMTPYEQAVWQQINLQWADKHHGLIAGLRDGSLVAVPREPTDAMLKAFHEAETRLATSGQPVNSIREMNNDLCRASWAAMLAAAQEPPR